MCGLDCLQLRHCWFQFYYSAIKIELGGDRDTGSEAFQFYYSAIKIIVSALSYSVRLCVSILL